jgi:hypothetical protein
MDAQEFTTFKKWANINANPGNIQDWMILHF